MSDIDGYIQSVRSLRNSVQGVQMNGLSLADMADDLSNMEY